MFLTLVLAGLVHLELVKAAGTTRVINFASNVASLTVWLMGGKILFSLALPCMACAVAGNFIGRDFTLSLSMRSEAEAEDIIIHIKGIIK